MTLANSPDHGPMTLATDIAAFRNDAARRRVYFNVTRDWFLSQTIRNEARCWTRDERAQSFVRALVTFRYALRFVRDETFPKEQGDLARVLAHTALRVVDELLERGRCEAAFAHGMEVLQLVVERGMENERSRRARGVTPYEHFIGGNAGVLTQLASACASLVIWRDVQHTPEDIALLVDAARLLRPYQRNDIEVFVTAGARSSGPR